MSLHIRAHFDGRFLVPDQPVDLPVNQPLDVEVTPRAVSGNGAATDSLKEQLRKLDDFFALPPLGNVPAESLRRENLYEERM